MKELRTIEEMKKYSNYILCNRKIVGFVPTMGYLHEGHLSLVKKAREDTDIVVVSIFVNPTQFGEGEDLSTYPRDFQRDKQLCKEQGVDVIFAPEVDKLYPEPYLTYVNVENITEVMCGQSRPGHFKGVCTVVTKLFNIVKPHKAYFGQKDAQQYLVIKQMARDLNMDVEVIALPIIREADGIAMSSRNKYLTGQERNSATCLYKSLQKAKELIEKGIRDSTRIIKEMEEVINRERFAAIDYIEIRSTKNLKELDEVKGDVLIALAVKIGKARLIDNIIIEDVK